MDLFNLLHNEHEEMLDLLNRLVSARGNEKTLGLQNRLAELLIAHTTIEEKYLYPALQQSSQTMAEMFFDEHEQARNTMNLLKKQPVDSDFWRKLCWQLLEEVRDHLRKEEDELFPILRYNFEADQLERIAEQVNAYRNKRLQV